MFTRHNTRKSSGQKSREIHARHNTSSGDVTWDSRKTKHNAMRPIEITWDKHSIKNGICSVKFRWFAHVAQQTKNWYVINFRYKNTKSLLTAKDGSCLRHRHGRTQRTSDIESWGKYTAQHRGLSKTEFIGYRHDKTQYSIGNKR